MLSAPNVSGPWTFHGDVGSNPTPFDPHSPNNYVTKAQVLLKNDAVFDIVPLVRVCADQGEGVFGLIVVFFV